MPTAEGQITTDRASRYLVQLCRHLDQMSHQLPARHDTQAPPAVEHVGWSDTTGTIRFAQGTCTLHATNDALTLRVAADDEQTLRRLQQSIAQRLETIGRRDHITVHWRQSTTADNPSSKDNAIDMGAPTNPGGTRRARRAGGVLAIAAIAAVAILVHVGILGATLAASAWATWGTDIAVAIVALKIVTVALHVIFGRTAFRHRRRWIRDHRKSATDVRETHPHGQTA